MTNPVEKAKKTGTGMRPWLKAVMFVSLALNLAVAGVMIGAAVKYGPRDNHRPPRLDRMAGMYTHALSHKDRREIGAQLRKEYRAERPSRSELQAEFAGVLTALRAQPYDPAAVNALMKRQLDAGLERQSIGQRLLLQRLETMSFEDRAAFADRVEEGMTWRKKD